MKNKLILVDGNSLFYRAFYALPLLQNEKGEYTNAIYGFCNLITKLITEYKPTHLVVAFDAGKHTFRHNLYADYKGTRKPMPEELRSQAGPLRELLKLMGIKVIEISEIEADDILGTVAHKFLDDTIIVTGDRDAFQLIDYNTHVYFTKKGISDVQIVDEKEFERLYGFDPINIVDLKALQGDSSDNIPGAKGIGEKTALTLIKEYGTIENIYKNLDNITGKLHEKLVESKDMVYLSKTLATINDKVNLGCELEDCKFEFPFSKAVYDKMNEYNFKSITKREELFQSDIKREEKVKCEIKNIVNKKDLKNVIERIKQYKIFSFSVDEGDIHLSDGLVEYVIISSGIKVGENIHLENIVLELKSLFEDEKVETVLFDSKLYMHFLDKFSIDINNYFDVALAKHLCDGISVKDYNQVLLLEDMDKKYSASNLLYFKDKYKNYLEELNMHDLYYNLELPLIKVLYSMEKIGFAVDEKRLDELGVQYGKELKELTQKIYTLAGEEFNIDSPKQLATILYDKLNLYHDKKRSTDVDALSMIENDNEIISYILRYRKLAKLNGTYIKGLKDKIASDGRIHTNFKQTFTNTGRLSSSDPNLQNLPIKTDESREIRSIFTASAIDRVLIDVDYSQIELRVLAHLSGDESLVKAFKNNEDIHTLTACEIFGVEPNMVTREMRRNAKIVNFGVIYGISDYGLSKDLGITRKDAKKYIEEYYKMHPKIESFMKDAIAMAKETGRVTTILNRSRRMVDISNSNFMVRTRAERASQNMRLQGSAADIIKLAMLNVYNKLKNTDAKLIMQVHDELIVDCKKSDAERIQELVRYEMENAIKLNVPLDVDSSISYRWSEGH